MGRRVGPLPLVLHLGHRAAQGIEEMVALGLGGGQVGEEGQHVVAQLLTGPGHRTTKRRDSPR
jgi:hypothetical protein